MTPPTPAGILVFIWLFATVMIFGVTTLLHALHNLDDGKKLPVALPGIALIASVVALVCFISVVSEVHA